ncbi:hypothetical protein L1787_12965 [Acuticoccus sp. M5D2P5]|uniref:hypothetical protein n=1 Tax=Acuticoccus kalidii TaxID=2910977 RepID=UPI001F401C97|nr:hypothetical protein [Acuticoccus kalidii]MCF3934320.1 hypothetical protein [Acuticoccus kalidii]
MTTRQHETPDEVARFLLPKSLRSIAALRVIRQCAELYGWQLVWRATVDLTYAPRPVEPELMTMALSQACAARAESEPA